MMLSNTIPIIIAGATIQDISSVVRPINQTLRHGEPAKNIPGLVTRQFNIPMHLCDLQQFRIQCPSIQAWIWLDQSNQLFAFGERQKEKSRVTFGSFVSTGEFTYHKWIDNINIFLKKKPMELHVVTGENYFRLAADCLDTYFVFDPPNTFFLPLKKPVRCFTKLNQRDTKRIFSLTTHVQAADLADTSAICITLQNERARFLHKNLIKKFNLLCFYPVTKITTQQHISQLLDYRLVDETNFLTTHAWEMVLSLGFRMKDQINAELMSKINQLALSAKNDEYPDHLFYSKMIAIYHQAKNNRFFNFPLQYDRIKPAWLPVKQTGYDYIPRIYLTPYGKYPKTLKALRSNRVLRQTERFGLPTEHFCRVLLKDCDFESVQDYVLKEWRPVLQDILLNTGLIVAGLRFNFLLFSNSQLRDRSLTFYRSFGQTTVQDIHRWLGDFNQEEYIGKRLARMAQCFTSTTHGIPISKANLEKISDKFDNKNRCFTDGCGGISRNLLEKLFQKIREKEPGPTRLPSVIQIRCGGLKGVLVDTPNLTGEMIQYRPSQEKFQSNHLILELIKYSQPREIFFNQQAITLLEFMRVPTSVFVEFQYTCRKRLSMALISKKSAISLLRRTIRFYDWQKINNSGIVIPKEPFFRSLLMTMVKDRLQKLRDKSHIPIPMEDGRMLYGVVDETDSLEEGEVFIQISEETSDGKETNRIIKDTVVAVTRMPCYHPGDIRLLSAVDKGALHHLVDCIVFPAKGNRPHPTEMSGGDLDGDEYWACWSKKIVSAIRNVHQPDEYAAPKKPGSMGEPTQEQMVDCVLDILENSGKVGVLSNRHLALSALKNPADEKAIELARYINEALDFPKNGVSSMTLEKFKELNVPAYPNFMQNTTKQKFECDKALSVLFQYMQQTLDIHLSAKRTVETDLTDNDLLVPGFHKYISIAQVHYQDYCGKVNSILNTYDLKDETELITGCHFTTPEEPHTSDDVETAIQDFRALRVQLKQDFDRNMIESSQAAKQKLVSAYYHVAYSKVEENQEICLSFPWIFYEVLCQIKTNHTNSSIDENPSLSHQSLKLIGEALLASGECRPSNGYHPISVLSYSWLMKQEQNRKVWLPCFRLINSFVKTDEKFLSVENSNGSSASRLGEQFLLLLEWLCMNNDDQLRLEPVANLFLLKLHQIALKLRI